MSLRSRLILTLVSAGCLLALALFATLLTWKWQTQQTLALNALEQAITSEATWAQALHFEARQDADRLLAKLRRKIPNIQFAAAYLVDGRRLAGNPDSTGDFPRGNHENLTPTAITTRKLPSRGVDDSPIPSIIQRLLKLDQTLLISVPITAPINPADSTVLVSSYFQRYATTDNGPRYVVGYIEAGLPLAYLAVDMQTMALQTAAGLILLVLVIFLLARLLARSISRPLERLARAAEHITKGEIPQKFVIARGRKDEIAEIAAVLNSVIESVEAHKTKLNVDRTLLSMKVDAQQRKLSLAEQSVASSQQRLQKVAYYDPVTSLPNRRLMIEQLAMLMNIAAREKRHLGLLIIDISNIRRIRESFGTAATEHVLREIARRIESSIRQSDLVSRDESVNELSRVSDGEFAVILHGIAKTHDALAAANRMAQALSAAITWEDTPLSIALDMGIAMAPDHAKTAELLLRAADIAVNAARSRTSQQIVAYDTSLDQAGTERFQLELALRNANIDNEFSLHYQPQIDTKLGKVVGVEALLRWQHPSKGAIPPFQFIPIAEETGLIIRLGDWVIEQACRAMKALQTAELDVGKMSVNISALQLTPALITTVDAALKRHNLRPSCLQLELTESLLVQDVEAVIQKLHTLHDEVGVRLSIDDFGTGYSSLTYLAKYPLDELKVDRSFVVNMTNDEASAKVTGAIIAMARELGLSIVAEGVDSHDQLAQLDRLGAHVIQGFLFARPLPFDDLTDFLRSARYKNILSLYRNSN